jgi:hypothetical protein
MCPESPIFELFLHIIMRTLQSILSLQQTTLRGLVAKVETDRRKLLPDSAMTILHSMLWIVLGLHYTVHVHPGGLLKLGNQEHMSLLRNSPLTQSCSSEQTDKPPDGFVSPVVVAPAATAARHPRCELPDTDQQAAQSSQKPPPLPPCYNTTACLLSPIDSERAEAAFENNEEKENKRLLARDKSGNIVSAYKYQYSILAEEALRTLMSCVGLSVKLASSGADSSSSSFSSNRGNPAADTLQERLRILQTESIIHVARYRLNDAPVSCSWKNIDFCIWLICFKRFWNTAPNTVENDRFASLTIACMLARSTDFVSFPAAQPSVVLVQLQSASLTAIVPITMRLLERCRNDLQALGLFLLWQAVDATPPGIAATFLNWLLPHLYNYLEYVLCSLVDFLLLSPFFLCSTLHIIG